MSVSSACLPCSTLSNSRSISRIAKPSTAPLATARLSSDDAFTGVFLAIASMISLHGHLVLGCYRDCENAFGLSTASEYAVRPLSPTVELQVCMHEADCIDDAMNLFIDWSITSTYNLKNIHRRSLHPLTWIHHSRVHLRVAVYPGDTLIARQIVQHLPRTSGEPKDSLRLLGHPVVNIGVETQTTRFS